MRCPKCGGRTVIEDYHTYMGHEIQRKCIVCGKLFCEQPTPVDTGPEVDSLVVEEPPKPSKQSKSLGTCSVCKRPNQYLTRGMCGRDYQRWRKTEENTFIGPPRLPRESHWKKEVFHQEALAEHRANQPGQTELHISQVSHASQTYPETNPKEVRTMAATGTCVECKRENMAIVAKGRCGKCYAAGVKNGTITVIPRKPKVEAAAPAVPPLPTEPQEPTAAPSPAAIEFEPSEETSPEYTPVPVLFDDRDTKLLEKLQNSAYQNRRTLEQEILYRLDWSYDFHLMPEEKQARR